MISVESWMHVDAFLLYLCHRFDPLNNKYITFQKQKNRYIYIKTEVYCGDLAFTISAHQASVHLNTSPPSSALL